MPDPEVMMFTDDLLDKVDRIVGSMDGLSDDEIAKSPPVPNANSLLVLAVHTMANVEENILEIIGGQDVGRNRDSEFRVTGRSAEQVRADWQSLRERIRIFLNDMSPDALNTEYEHDRRGRITGRGVLLVAATHAAEHAGHAELTRDWLIAQRT